MNSASPPALTIWRGDSRLCFSAGHDVVVGRDLRADVRLTHPLISPVHLLLHFENGRWLAIDSGSRNGTFVEHRRVQVVGIHNGQRINIGNPDGPCLTFEVEPDGQTPPGVPLTMPANSARPTDFAPQLETRPAPQMDARPPWLPAMPRTAGSAARAEPPLQPPKHPRSGRPQPPETGHSVTPRPHRVHPGGGWNTDPLPQLTPTMAPSRVFQNGDPEGSSVRIGRAAGNDVVIDDVLASRHHAFLLKTPTGTEIRDAHSINGTFVNGVPVGTAPLSDGDVVTIGNVDLVFSGGTLTESDESGTGTGGLQVNAVQFTIDKKKLLDDISLTARPGTLTAIIGGSGAGKTTLSRLIAGYTRPTSGSITFEGHDIHREYASLRTRIGMVPQDNIVHRQLTVKQELRYAAELRLPPDTSKADRAKVVTDVLDELDLTDHADTRIEKLSGGQQKRASVALELLTGPSLLILDEPTTGLDPALDSQVMLTLRQLADSGRTVLVVTHSVSYLDLCDQVLLLAPGGRTAFYGPPDQVSSVMGTSNWAQIFLSVGADPDEANRRYVAQQRPRAPSPAAPTPGDLGEPVRVDGRRQFRTIARRQIRLVISDRWYTVFLALLPFVVGLLALTVPGDGGFGPADPHGKTPAEPAQILVLLNLGAVFMGTALTVRDLVGERPIFHRERAFGLSTAAYLMAKLAVFSAFAVAQAGIATAIAVHGKGPPTRGAVLLGNASVELFVAVAGTCVVSAIIGLALSALARSSDQILPLLVVAIMAQLVFSSGMIPVTNRVVLDQLSWFTPARWGFAASASTIDLNGVEPGPFSPKDSHWNHSMSAWLIDMGMLVTLAVFYSGIVRWKIRLKRH